MVVVHSDFLPRHPIFPFRYLGCSKRTNYFLNNTKPFAILYTQTTKLELHVTLILGMQMTMHSRYSHIPEPPYYSCLVQHWFMHTLSYSLHLFSQRNPKPNLCPHRNLGLYTKYPKLNISLYLHTHYWTSTTYFKYFMASLNTIQTYHTEIFELFCECVLATMIGAFGTLT